MEMLKPLSVEPLRVSCLSTVTLHAWEAKYPQNPQDGSGIYATESGTGARISYLEPPKGALES